MKEKVTIENILLWFKTAIENKEPIDPITWLDSAQKLVVLLEDVDNELDSMEATFAEEKRKQVLKGKSVAMAETLKYDNRDYYEHYLRLKSLKERVKEHIRLAKARQQHPAFQ